MIQKMYSVDIRHSLLFQKKCNELDMWKDQNNQMCDASGYT